MPHAGKNQRLRELIAARGWRHIGEAEWNEILGAIPDISATAFQRLEIPVDPPWCGIPQHSLEELEASLLVMGEVYAARPDLRRSCRDRVIEARARAYHASRKIRVPARKSGATRPKWPNGCWSGWAIPRCLPRVRLRIDLLRNSMGVVILST